MSLTVTQKQQIRFSLGWPSFVYYENTDELDQALTAIDGNDDAVTLAIALLASIADVDTKLLAAHDLLQVLKSGTVTLPGSLQIYMLRNEGRRFVGRLSGLLGIPKRQDIYSDQSTNVSNEMLI